MNAFFSPAPVRLHKVLAVLRIIVGLLLVYHGQEVFNPEVMKGYAEWELFKDRPATLMVYAGKGAELIAGVLFSLGLFTRISAVITIGTFAYITFFVGNGHFWYEDQHPFMFVLTGVLFLFSGPGAWSLDERFFGKSEVHY